MRLVPDTFLTFLVAGNFPGKKRTSRDILDEVHFPVAIIVHSPFNLAHHGSGPSGPHAEGTSSCNPIWLAQPLIIVAQADKMASSASGGFSMFGGRTEKWENAADLYTQAANAFRMQKQSRPPLPITRSPVKLTQHPPPRRRSRRRLRKSRLNPTI
jgi:Soluble NSF attachment protein, SNAP